MPPPSPPLVTPHVNPSSHFDDDELIMDSTQLEYRNPPEAKPQNLYPTDSFKPPDWVVPAQLGSSAQKYSRQKSLPDEISSYVQESPITIKNPVIEKPVAASRSTTGSEKTHSTSSTSSSKRTYQLWQCAHCEKINKAHHVSCENCGLARGKMAVRSIFCDFCQLMIFVPPSREFKDTCCPRCKQVHDSAL